MDSNPETSSHAMVLIKACRRLWSLSRKGRGKESDYLALVAIGFARPAGSWHAIVRAERLCACDSLWVCHAPHFLHAIVGDSSSCPEDSSVCAW